MALIKCPECGGEISTSAKNCDHCGCKIAVCPDCGHVTVGDMLTCTNCGCVVKQSQEDKSLTDNRSSNNISAKPTAQTDANAKNGVTVYEKWMAASAFDVVLFKRQKMIKRIIDIFSTVLLVVALAVLFIWGDDSDKLNQLSNFNTTLTWVRALVIIALIFYALGASDFIDVIVTFRLARWINTEKINIAEEIKYFSCAVTAGESKIAKYYELFCNAAYINSDNGGKIKYIAKRILNYAAGIAFFVSLAVFAYINASILMAAYMIDISRFKGDFTALIVAGVAVGVIILGIIIDVCVGYKSSLEKWMQIILTENEINK